MVARNEIEADVIFLSCIDAYNATDAAVPEDGTPDRAARWWAHLEKEVEARIGPSPPSPFSRTLEVENDVPIRDDDVIAFDDGTRMTVGQMREAGKYWMNGHLIELSETTR